MNIFFLTLEICSYLFALFLFIKKKELAIIYVPVLIFVNNVIEPSFSALVYYGTVSLLILSCIAKNHTFYQKNIFALLIFVYFLVLLTRSSDLVFIRSGVFSVLWLFLSIPLIPAVYSKYTDSVIFKEITNAALCVLVVFIVNVLFSTVYKYSPNAMYGITEGLMYGNVYGAGFNILPVAVFLLALKLVESRKPVYFLIIVVSLFCILLSLRRTVMILSLAGVVVAFISMLSFKRAKSFLTIGCLLFLAGYIIYSNTDFADEFNKRYELRNLDEREMAEEKRFIEYELIYDDMFENNDYSPWIGYELLNSAGNYGRGVFELRTLHADLPSIAHSSGVIGLCLYLLMMITAFFRAFKMASTGLDKLIVFFCLVSLVSYTITGRFTEAASMILLFLVLMLPFARSTDYSPEPAGELVSAKPAFY
jgi:hypothetical protein